MSQSCNIVVLENLVYLFCSLYYLYMPWKVRKKFPENIKNHFIKKYRIITKKNFPRKHLRLSAFVKSVSDLYACMKVNKRNSLENVGLYIFSSLLTHIYTHVYV